MYTSSMCAQLAHTPQQQRHPHQPSHGTRALWEGAQEVRGLYISPNEDLKWQRGQGAGGRG